VDDRLDVRIPNKGRNCTGIHLERVDRAHLGRVGVAPAHLHEREFRDVAALRHELQVEGERTRLPDRLRDRGNFLGRIDQCLSRLRSHGGTITRWPRMLATALSM